MRGAGIGQSMPKQNAPLLITPYRHNSYAPIPNDVAAARLGFLDDRIDAREVRMVVMAWAHLARILHRVAPVTRAGNCRFLCAIS